MIKKEKKQSKIQLPQPEKGVDPQSEEELTGLLSQLHIPPGVALNDIFLDNEDVPASYTFANAYSPIFVKTATCRSRNWPGMERYFT